MVSSRKFTSMSMIPQQREWRSYALHCVVIKTAIDFALNPAQLTHDGNTANTPETRHITKISQIAIRFIDTQPLIQVRGPVPGRAALHASACQDNERLPVLVFWGVS
jgi:hypothetical protein